MEHICQQQWWPVAEEGYCVHLFICTFKISAEAKNAIFWI